MKRILAFFVFAVFLIILSASTFAETADKTELALLLNEIYDPSLYTADSYQKYQQAINKAIVIYEDDAASDDEVILATLELKTAKDTLVLILNREPLLTYIDRIEELLYGINCNLSPEMIQILTDAKNEFSNLYASETLTLEQLAAANTKFFNVIEIAESGDEIKEFSSENAGEDIIIPQKLISSTQGLGRVTKIRLTLLGIGSGIFIIGLIATILYLKPPKFFK